MKIIVCMKQVPAAATASIDPLTKTIVRTGRNAVTNPFDLHALQAALVYETGYQENQFALIHPGGAVGERLNKK